MKPSSRIGRCCWSSSRSAAPYWLGHLVDALELVDWRSGEIRKRATNDWLLTECLAALRRIDHATVRKWVKTLRRHQPQLLTSLDWLASMIDLDKETPQFISPNCSPASIG